MELQYTYDHSLWNSVTRQNIVFPNGTMILIIIALEHQYNTSFLCATCTRLRTAMFDFTVPSLCFCSDPRITFLTHKNIVHKIAAYLDGDCLVALVWEGDLSLVVPLRVLGVLGHLHTQGHQQGIREK